MINHKIRALIFDRDGTIIEHVHYLSDPAQVRLLPGVKEGMKLLKELGFKLFMHSNQSAVGRNYFGIEKVYACNLRMEELLDLGKDVFERVCIATETPTDPIVYRKPSPQFAKEIMNDHNFKPSELCYVGDRSSDLQTALNIGANAIGVNTGLNDLHIELREVGLFTPFPIFSSFSEVIEELVKK